MELTFRDKKMSKETKRRILLLIAVFFVALLFFNFVLNFKESETATAMTPPSLPVITVDREGLSEARLFGYKKEMDACYMRDTVLALDENRTIPMTIHTHGARIEGLSYEIRSTDTTRKIAETEITDLERDGDVITAAPSLENLIEEGEEYLLVIKLGVDGETIRYYTRIMMTGDSYARECMDFAVLFSKKARAGKQEFLATYMEPDRDYADDELSHVTIHSPLDMVAWSGFEGKLFEDPVAEIKDINSDYCAIELYYILQADSGVSRYYNVREYFKLRYGSERIFMLDYDRTMEEILDEDRIRIEGNVLSLGPHPGELSYLSNETGSIVAFTQAGSLFEYNENTGIMTGVYDFRRDDFLDWRAGHDEHAIRILNIDESGTMDFAVYGYMNCGSHEGECGIDLFHYDAATGRARERIFISSTDSYQILSARFSSILYMSTKNVFYIMVDGTLLEVNLGTMTNREVVTGLSEGQYASSKSSRYFAYITEENVADSIHMMDLEEGTSYEITAREGSLLRPVDFLDEDFVYGNVREKDISPDATRHMIYPMNQLFIRQSDDEDGKVLKKYKKTGYYITSSEKDGTTLVLHRVVKSGDTYKSAPDDTIRNSSGEMNKEVEVSTAEDPITGSGMQITMTDIESLAHKENSTGRSELVLLDKGMSISVSAGENSDMYFSYVGSQIIYAGSDLTRAIAEADAQMGIVVDTRSHYIWKRGRPSVKDPITGIVVGSTDADANSAAKCLSAMLGLAGENVQVNELLSAGESPEAILRSAMKDRMILDVTGCSLTEVLYYVGRSMPVYAGMGADDALLITGYDMYNVIVYDADAGENKKIGLKDAAALFEESGNEFLTYMEEK
ncbi:MAG: hypothetical protein K6B14_09665 [Lachnospiraceae bacterium]|nr:hypothetical protein [Lachnospiraceae bacterium]